MSVSLSKIEPKRVHDIITSRLNLFINIFSLSSIPTGGKLKTSVALVAEKVMIFLRASEGEKNPPLQLCDYIYF
jgi:hypothetical protein